MSAAEQTVLLEQNDLIAFDEEALKIIHEANEGQAVRQLGIIENPRKSWLWDFDFIKPNQWSLDTSDVEVWTDAVYLPRFWGGVRANKQRLRTNMLSAKQALHVEGMKGAQCHNHHLQEWEPWKTSLGEWVMVNHVHFLVDMIADHIKKGLIVTSADTAKIPREALAPRAPAILDTTTSSKRRWLQHDETTRKWSRPIIRLAARPKPEARPRSGRKAEPAAKRRPGALKTALLATSATAASSLPREVPLMHTQENSNRFVIKVAPEGSLQGFQIPYIEDLIHIEPCTLRGKPLLKERKECAFSEPQFRAYMGQQPGGLSSKRTPQPLPTTGLEEEAAFQSGIQMANASWLPSDGVAFTRDTMLPAAWSVQSRTSLRRQKRTFTQILQELKRNLQPLQKRVKMRASPHQRYLGNITLLEFSPSCD